MGVYVICAYACCMYVLMICVYLYSLYVSVHLFSLSAPVCLRSLYASVHVACSILYILRFCALAIVVHIWVFVLFVCSVCS